MSLLKTGACFTNELKLAPNKVEIAKTFKDCSGAALVPDTMLATCADIPAPQVLSVSGDTLTLSGGGGSVVLPDTQDLSISGNVISLTNGGSVTLPTTAAPTPQVLSVSGDTLTLSGGGGSVVLPDTQDLSISGNVISLTNGGSITLPTTVAPAPQVLSISGDTLTLSGGGGAVTLPDTQDLSISGNVLSLTNGGSVTLPSGATYAAATACEVPTKLYGEVGGVAKQFDMSAIASTAIAVQTPPGFNVVGIGTVQTSQINNPSACRSMLVTAFAEYSMDYPQFGHGDTHLYYALNTTGFGAVNTLPAQYHDNNGYAGGTNLTLYRSIVVPPGGSAYFSTRTEYGAGNSSLATLYNHFLTGITI